MEIECDSQIYERKVHKYCDVREQILTMKKGIYCSDYFVKK